MDVDNSRQGLDRSAGSGLDLEAAGDGYLDFAARQVEDDGDAAAVRISRWMRLEPNLEPKAMLSDASDVTTSTKQLILWWVHKDSNLGPAD